MLAAAALLTVLLSVGATDSRQPAAKVGQQAALGGLPPLFVKNRGQVDHRADYYVQGHDSAVFFTRRGLALSLLDPKQKHPVGLRLDFLGVGAGVRPVGQARTHAVTSYFKGKPADWKTNVPTYSNVAYHDLWPGIDLVYKGKGSQLEYSFLVKPGADPRDIRLGWRGATGLGVNAAGQLKVSTAARTLVDDAPTTYQSAGGRRTAVDSSYAVGAKKTYGFRVGRYDHNRPLVIDPVVLLYSGFIGGSSSESGGNVALDAARNLYVIGSTRSADFPATVGPDTSFNDTTLTDAYVAKVNPEGTGLVYAGFIGGNQPDTPFNIAVDSTGAAYVGGSTCSKETDGFPVKVGPDLTFNGGPQDAWVAKVKPDGTGLDYAGYIGGAGTGAPPPNQDVCANNNEQANGLAVDATGAAYLSGFTKSDEDTFPTGNGFGAIPGFDTAFNGILDAWVAKVKPDGSGLVYATYVGGGGADAGTGLRVDAAGNAYANIFTGSNERPPGPMNPFGDFPVTQGAFDTTFNAPPGPPNPQPSDTAAVKLDPSGTNLIYATYIGGAGSEQPFGNAVDGAGNVYITGQTSSDEGTFPNGQGFGTIPGFDHVLNAGHSDQPLSDGFVVKLNATGSALDYATYVGGSGDEQPIGIDLDSAGSAYIAGSTSSADGTFPAANGLSSTFNGDPTDTTDAFVAKLNPSGTGLDYAGFIGGTGTDDAIGMKVDPDGNAYVSGQTDSDQSTFPVTVGPDLTQNGATDGWVAKIGVPPPPTTTVTPTPVTPTPVTPTPTPTSTVTPPPPTTKRVKVRLVVRVKPKRDRRRPYRYTARARVVLPKHKSKKNLCGPGGKVSIQSKRGKKTISTRRKKISKSCRATIHLKFASAKRLGLGRHRPVTIKMTGRFAGNKRLKSDKAKPVRVKAG